MCCNVGQGFRRLQNQKVDREGGPSFLLSSPWKKDSCFAQVDIAGVAAHAPDEHACLQSSVELIVVHGRCFQSKRVPCSF